MRTLAMTTINRRRLWRLPRWTVNAPLISPLTRIMGSTSAKV
jgi:hypothetical protein